MDNTFNRASTCHFAFDGSNGRSNTASARRARRANRRRARRIANAIAFADAR